MEAKFWEPEASGVFAVYVCPLHFSTPHSAYITIHNSILHLIFSTCTFPLKLAFTSLNALSTLKPWQAFSLKQG